MSMLDTDPWKAGGYQGFEDFPADRYEQKLPTFYTSEESLDAFGNRGDLRSTQEAADLVFGAIFEGTAGKSSLPASILDILGGGSLEGLSQFVGGVPIVGDLVEAITGIEDGDYSDLGTWVGLLFGRDASLASRVSAIENKLAVGSEYYDNFKRGDNDSVLGSPEPGVVPPWVQFGDGEALGIHDQAAQMTRSAFPDDGIRYARCPFLATSANYEVGVVVHPRGTPNQPRTTIYGRCNADMTEGVYVDFFGNKTRIGRFTRSGLTVNRTQWGPDYPKAYSNSSTPKLRMIGTRYQVIIDDVVIIDHPDTSSFPVDMAHVTSGFSVQCWTAILAVPQWSAGLAAFAVRNADQSAIAQAVQQANNAEAAAGAVLGIAENADAKATAAQETANSVEDIALAAQTSADVAYAAAARWKDEFIVASAGVVLGKNELALGVVMDVPAGRTRKISRVIYGLITNTGAMTVQLISTSPSRVSTVIHTSTIPAGVVEFIDNSPDISVLDGHRISCTVTAIGGNSSVLQCALIGALL
ncbi:hypothetical protein CH300_00015 [Rhodococcus sp. 15-1154-1]|nr:hypothetical protein [Rhodococcus sp. 15-1154-1]OZF09800.1 hypothetical protein CH300_00015 [Rhodococcus sp. 15-1154-1]